MSEVEQLRKELNELRERIALLEKKQLTQPLSPMPYNGTPVWYGPYPVTCNG